MPLTIPSRLTVVNSLRNYIRNNLPTLDTSTERRSLIGGLITSIGSGLTDWYVAMKRWVDKEPWPQTATADGTLYSGWWQAITKLQPNPATTAAGFICIGGTASTLIPGGTQMTANGVTYATKFDTPIIANPFTASSLTTDIYGNATFTTVNPHMIATGMSVTVSGAIPSTYNGTYTVTALSATTFTYLMASVPGSPASGGITATSTFASVEVQATSTGEITNLSSGASLTLTSAPAGANSTAYVTFYGVSGGADTETDASYRARTLQALGTDFGMFTSNEIQEVVMTYPNVARVMIRTAQVTPASGWPSEGQVKLAFLMNNPANPFPSAQDVTNVKNILINEVMPAHMASADLIVMSPLQFAVNFTFTSLTPDTPGMRASIQAILTQFFNEQVSWGGTLYQDQYRCAILEAFDTQTRQALTTFTVSQPTGNLIAGTTPGFSVDAIPTLGAIVWPN
jgi:hypothetical protein